MKITTCEKINKEHPFHNIGYITDPHTFISYFYVQNKKDNEIIGKLSTATIRDIVAMIGKNNFHKIIDEICKT